MQARWNKKGFEIILSQLKTFDNPKVRAEQYSTTPEVANFIWDIQEELENKTILDLGAGTGILGLGTLTVGAAHVYFIEQDTSVLPFLDHNIEDIAEQQLGKQSQTTIINKPIEEIERSDFKEPELVVIQNPPFGTKEKHADKAFLEKAMELANTIYSIHKIESKQFIESLCRDHNWTCTLLEEKEFILKRTMDHHKKDKYSVTVGIWKLHKS